MCLWSDIPYRFVFSSSGLGRALLKQTPADTGRLGTTSDDSDFNRQLWLRTTPIADNFDSEQLRLWTTPTPDNSDSGRLQTILDGSRSVLSKLLLDRVPLGSENTFAEAHIHWEHTFLKLISKFLIKNIFQSCSRHASWKFNFNET